MRTNRMLSFTFSAMVFATIVGSVLLGCQKGTESEPASRSLAGQTVSRLSDDDAINEAVLRYLLYDGWKDYWQGRTDKRFVSIDGADPSDALLERFSDYEFTLHKFSGCDDTFNGVFDKETGELAILYHIRAPIEIDDQKVEVHFFLKSFGWGGTMATLTVEKNEGTWNVTGQSPIMKA